MIHLPTASSGQVSHQVKLGDVVRAGQLLTRVQPAEGPVEEIIAPFDARIGALRLGGAQAMKFSRVVGLVPVVLSTCEGRLRWILELGSVGAGTLVALVGTAEGVRPHRAALSGFIAQVGAQAGERVKAGQVLIELRDEGLA